MYDMPEHFPMDVDVDGNGPVQRHDPRYARTVCWCGQDGCRKFEHVLSVQGPVRYPGGKDGTFNVVCSCGRYVSPPGDSARSGRMWQAAQAHQAAKTAS